MAVACVPIFFETPLNCQQHWANAPRFFSSWGITTLTKSMNWTSRKEKKTCWLIRCTASIKCINLPTATNASILSWQQPSMYFDAYESCWSSWSMTEHLNIYIKFSCTFIFCFRFLNTSWLSIPVEVKNSLKFCFGSLLTQTSSSVLLRPLRNFCLWQLDRRQYLVFLPFLEHSSYQSSLPIGIIVFFSLKLLFPIFNYRMLSGMLSSPALIWSHMWFNFIQPYLRLSIRYWVKNLPCPGTFGKKVN